MRELVFKADQSVLDLGVKIVTYRVSGIQNSRSNEEFENYKNLELENIKKAWEGKKYKDDPILAGFRDLHSKVGRSNRDYVASPEGLRWLFLERARFPKINTLVDIYNLISLKTGLALGAHDVDKIQGNITLRLTTGDENFIPLGKKEPEKVFTGEYAYVDDGDNIICRMEVLQVEPTKTTEDTKDVFLIIQGNPNTGDELVQRTAEEVCELIIRYLGGNKEFL